ncbi:EF-hand calcium-binding domain-containing protein 4B [Cichlidogyrus casuarinus]|uniref:EF-hand calcium-binding domain-containing protein 4B n=1 Tax=Cichlidogyrus casuarinus TaxID=1844966 RepID=A0ABD2PLD0_9PLAT
MTEAEIQRQAELIFRQCDQDNKGYLVPDDLRVLLDFIPMDECQLEDVFVSLDADKDGKLTLAEFLSRFGQYLNAGRSRDSFYGQPEGSDDSFEENMGACEIKECLEDVELVEEIWKQVRRENPSLLPDFEKLLTKISEKLQRSKDEYHSIENEMRIRKNAHEDEIRRLYEEVESQIKCESQKMIEKVSVQFRSLF